MGDFDLEPLLRQAADLLDLMAADPEAAAVELEHWAAELLGLAALLRGGADTPHSDGGMGERVMMRCVGPDGAEQQFTDTGRVGQ